MILEVPGFSDDARAISPAVGVILLLGIVVTLVAVLGVMTLQFAAEIEADEAEVISEDQTGEDGTYRSELVWARDDAASATTSHVVNYTIVSGSDAAGNSLNSVVINYAAGAMDASGLNSRDEVVMVGIDTNQDGTVDTDATNDVECCPPDDGVKISDGGTTVTIELSGNYDLEGGDSLIVEYESVVNPSSDGNYSTTIGVNGDATSSGSLDIS